MRVRPGTLGDLDFLVHGNRAMAMETEGLDLPEEVVRAGVRAVLEGTQAGAYRVLEVDGRPAAQLMLTYEWSDWRNRIVWWIQSVWVEPDHRRKGCYRRLYEAVRDEAAEAGAAGLRLYVDISNERAQTVYATLGMDGAHYRLFEEMF